MGLIAKYADNKREFIPVIEKGWRYTLNLIRILWSFVSEAKSKIYVAGK